VTHVVELGRRVSLGVLAGAIAGLVACGIGGRLFMSALAALNPDVAGIKSDDGFTMGQVTLSGTVNLLFVTTVIGAVAGWCGSPCADCGSVRRGGARSACLWRPCS